MEPYPHIYLSPHLDDVVLSCGGRIWQQVQSGARVLVVTVFAGAPPPDTPFSPLARALHARWGKPDNVVAGRQSEDRAALALLGADVAHWPYPDCIYRRAPDGRPLYADWESLWGESDPLEEGLVAELAARIAALPLQNEGVLYAPLGVGHHVDHQIVHRAALASGHIPLCYDDFPYAGDPQALPAAPEGQWQAELTPLSVEAVEARIKAIACYRSQLSSFWASEEEMAAAVRVSAEQTGEGKPAERYWKPGFTGATHSSTSQRKEGLPVPTIADAVRYPQRRRLLLGRVAENLTLTLGSYRAVWLAPSRSSSARSIAALTAS